MINIFTPMLKTYILPLPFKMAVYKWGSENWHSKIIFHLRKLWKAKFFIMYWVYNWGCRENSKMITLLSERVKLEHCRVSFCVQPDDKRLIWTIGYMFRSIPLFSICPAPPLIPVQPRTPVDTLQETATLGFLCLRNGFSTMNTRYTNYARPMLIKLGDAAFPFA